MRQTDYRRLIWSAFLALGLVSVGAASPVSAQTSAEPGAMQTERMNEDNDTDWGWIGLLGLAGLLGLRRRDHHVDRVDTTRTTRP